jgi:lysozyme family protein
VNVELWLHRILGNEGGYTAGEGDPGGETKWGISKRSYQDLDIKNLTVEQAAAIYKLDFLEPIKAERYSDGVAYQLLDFAVNSGMETALRKLQTAVGVVDDGHIGPITLEALAAMSESDTIMRFLAERLDFMTRLNNWPNASRGWVRRVAQDLRYGAEDSD